MLALDVLGCSGGWPAPGRACSGYLLTADAARIWVDAGGGTFERLLSRCPPADLDAVWITHLHPDHCADLLMAFQALAYGGHRSSRLPVYGPPGWAAAVDALVDAPCAEVFDVRELTDRHTYEIGGVPCEAVATHHGMPSFGLRARADGRTLAYTSDTAPGPATAYLAENADLLVAEAFLALPGQRPFTTVSTPEQAAQYARDGGARKLVLTHLHPDADPERARRRAATVYPGPVEVAREGASLRP